MFKKLPLYSILFSIYPVLALVAYNIQEVSIGYIYRPIIVSLFLGVFIFGLTRLIVRDWHRAALVSLIVPFLFFTYGQIYNVVEDLTIAGVAIFRHRTLGPLWGILMLTAVFWALRRRQPHALTPWLNLLSACLLIYPVLTVSSHVIYDWSAHYFAKKGIVASVDAANAKQPDIYYIILDGYGRDDILRNYFGYDNMEFVNALRRRGFYVADCSQSNYAYTQYSIASSLNYDYLDSLKALNYRRRVKLLQHGTVRSFLEEHGYKTAGFSTGYDWTEWGDADIYLDYEHPFTELNDFERLIVDTTLLRIPSDYARLHPENQFNLFGSFLAEDPSRSRTLSALSNLKKLPAMQGRLFVFAHLVIPHGPYVFGPDGERVHYQETIPYETLTKAYIDQVKFINHEILKVIDVILTESETPPVIVIQGDHGPPYGLSLSYKQKMPILNAYYLPGTNAGDVLYPSISPVNTFRVILNSYFDQHLPVLEDRSYYAEELTKDNFELVPNSCPNKP